MDCPHDEHARRRREECRLNGCTVTDLTHEQEVGILTQRTAHSIGKGSKIPPLFPLTEKGTICGKNIFDGILKCDDMEGTRMVDRINERGKRCRLACPRRSAEQYEPIPHLKSRTHGRRHTDLIGRHDALRQETQGKSHPLLRPIKVSSKPPSLPVPRGIDILHRKKSALRIREHLTGTRLHQCRCGNEILRHQHAVTAQLYLLMRCRMEIRGIHCHHAAQQFLPRVRFIHRVHAPPPLTSSPLR